MLVTALVLLDTFIIELASAVVIGAIGLIAKYCFINPLDETIADCIGKFNE